MATLAAWVFAGCTHMQYADPNPKKRFMFPGEQPAVASATNPSQPAPSQSSAVRTSPPATSNAQPNVATQTSASPPGAATNAPSSGAVGMIRVGEKVTVSFSDLPKDVQIPKVEIRIAEDGQIPLPYNISVHAAGKTTRQLEQEIRSQYVPRYYNYMTVTVTTEERWYYVGGEVKVPNRVFYTGPITVLRAIDSVGGFTDFANRNNIELTRQNGEKIKVSWKKVLKNPKLDPEVFPNDQIIVHRRW